MGGKLTFATRPAEGDQLIGKLSGSITILNDPGGMAFLPKGKS